MLPLLVFLERILPIVIFTALGTIAFWLFKLAWEKWHMNSKHKYFIQARRAYHKFREDIINTDLTMDISALRAYLLGIINDNNFCAFTERYRALVIDKKFSNSAGFTDIVCCARCIAYKHCPAWAVLNDHAKDITSDNPNYGLRIIFGTTIGAQINLLRVAFMYLPHESLILFLLKLSAALQVENQTFWES